jgi:exodeoxyribonuclease V gamma subunit
VLHLTSADRVKPLVSALAEVLATPLSDPLATEWVAVPTVGMRRWLALELAGSLGASGPDATDGIAANISFPLPGALRQSILEAGRSDGDVDPWQVDRLVWAILDVLHQERADSRLGPLTTVPSGGNWFGRARRLADLFDRYATWHPDLMLQWRDGNDVDATGRALGQEEGWQPHLWRLCRARIGEPSPPERLPGRLDQLRAGTLDLALPPRLAVFGLTTLPNGASFLNLARAIAVHRDLHLFLFDPSPKSTADLRASTVAAAPPPELLRVDDRSADAVHHPLLRSWGRPYRERTILLTVAERDGVPQPSTAVGAIPEGQRPGTLLAQLQDELRAGVAPSGSFDLPIDDDSIQVHSCHGQSRQVEVLRDAILHLLADDPTLREEDIVVLSPAIEQFAPLVEAGFGTSADVGGPTLPGLPPRLRYRITDRALREPNPLLAALGSLLELVSGRCTASELLEFVSQAGVRQRFDLDEDDLATLADWAARTNVRWGLNGPHREPWDLPAQFNANSWQAMTDRVLMGVAVSDDDGRLAPDDIAPLGVEGGDIALVGRFADVVARLAAVTDDIGRPRTTAQWCETLSDISEQFLAVEPEKKWQLEQLRRTIVAIRDQAVVGGQPSTVLLTLADLRRLLVEHFRGAAPRSDFFRGGITVTSLAPLRWLPFRVVCLLGLDDAGTTVGNDQLDGDDIAAQTPHLGDRDPRAELRQELLEAVLAPSDHLIITRTGRNLRTNQKVPSAVVFAELRDTIVSTLSPASQHEYGDRIETIHPRQPFDPLCFEPAALRTPGPWSFDPGARGGALARAERTDESPSFMDRPLTPLTPQEPVVTLAELQAFFNHPVRAFMRSRLRLHLPRTEDNPSDDLTTTMPGLERWMVADRLIEARRGGLSNEVWERHERALGTLPPGGLGDDAVVRLRGEVDAVLAVADTVGVDPCSNELHVVNVQLGDGTRIVGEVGINCAAPNRGPATVTFSHAKPKHHVAAWLDLMALVATDPEPDWHSLVVSRAASGDKPGLLHLRACGDTPGTRQALARAALGVAVDCYRRGMCEPIPLFAVLSEKLARGSERPSDWIATHSRADGDDDANQLAFGEITLRELCALPARDGDPPGSSPGRAHRFARYLWDAIDTSTELAT